MFKWLFRNKKNKESSYVWNDKKDIPIKNEQHSVKVIDSPRYHVAPKRIKEYVENLSQKEATRKIIEDTDFDKAGSIAELEEYSRARSESLYEERQQRISLFDPYKIQPTDLPPTELTNLEKKFLKQMHGNFVDHPQVNAYWTYEYNINFEQLMTKLMENGYLRVSNAQDGVKRITVSELKDLLKQFKCKVAGKKQELIERVFSEISADELENYFSDKPRTYALTDIGSTAVSEYQESAMADIDIENSCIKLILSGDVNSAYKLIALTESRKEIPRGLGMNWTDEFRYGLSDFRIQNFTNLLEKDIRCDVPDELLPQVKYIKACSILAVMLGKNGIEMAKTFERITGAASKVHGVSSALISKYALELLQSEQMENIRSLNS